MDGTGGTLCRIAAGGLIRLKPAVQSDISVVYLGTMNIFDRVYEAVRLIPAGSVATYGQVAQAVGNPRLSRVVGYALHVNPEPGVIPCHRVVKRDGEVSSAFAFGGPGRQAELLQAEGVGFTDETHVDMARYRVSFLPGIPAEPQRNG